MKTPRDIRRLTADLAAAREELAYWKTCANCGQQMDAPGLCSVAQHEWQKGAEQTEEQLLTRAESAESQLAAATEARERLKVWLQGEMAVASATINNTQPNGPTESFYVATGLHAAYRATLAQLSDAQRPVCPADKE